MSKSNLPTEPIAPKLRFITVDEVKRLRALISSSDHLNNHRSLVSSSGVGDARKAAEAAYIAAPTNKALELVLVKATEYAILERDLRPKEVVGDAIQRFNKNDVAPFVVGLLDRGIECAEQALAAVTADENERALQLTGRKLVASEIIDAARAPLLDLQEKRKFFAAAADVRSAIGASMQRLIDENSLATGS